jgi:hypothetical protein
MENREKNKNVLMGDKFRPEVLFEVGDIHGKIGKITRSKRPLLSDILRNITILNFHPSNWTKNLPFGVR